MRNTRPFQTERSWILPDLFARAAVRIEDDESIPEISITSLTDDSRAVAPGACFVAIRGAGRDGHEFIPAALKGGAAAIVVEYKAQKPCNAAVVRVHDTREALSKLAAAFYGLRGAADPPLRLIGVTGTNGKTTVTWLLRSILQAACEPTALLGTVEYDLLAERRAAPLTTPGSLELCRCLAMARDAGATYSVLEVSSHALDQRRCDGLKFTAGVYTNLSGDHLDYHRTMDDYFAAKCRLFERLEPPAVAVLNAEDARTGALKDRCAVPVVTFGIDDARADVVGRIQSLDRRGTRFSIRGRSLEMSIQTSLIGRHNVSNALAATATAEAVGIPSSAIQDGLQRASGAPGRLQRVESTSWPFSVFVDYAHTDDALRNVLTALRPLTGRRLLCVFGCGGDRDRRKRPRMAAVVGELADAAYVTSDNPRTEDPHAIIDEILPGFSRSSACRVEVNADRRRAIEAALSAAGPGDTVLIAGKGHETYQLVGDRVLHFDDVEVARRWLETASITEAVA